VDFHSDTNPPGAGEGRLAADLFAEETWASMRWPARLGNPAVSRKFSDDDDLFLLGPLTYGDGGSVM